MSVKSLVEGPRMAVHVFKCAFLQLKPWLCHHRERSLWDPAAILGLWLVPQVGFYEQPRSILVQTWGTSFEVFGQTQSKGKSGRQFSGNLRDTINPTVEMFLMFYSCSWSFVTQFLKAHITRRNITFSGRFYMSRCTRCVSALFSQVKIICSRSGLVVLSGFCVRDFRQPCDSEMVSLDISLWNAFPFWNRWLIPLWWAARVISPLQ